MRELRQGMAPSLRITLLYLFAASLWVVLSNWLGTASPAVPVTARWADLALEWLLVGVTAAILFRLLRRGEVRLGAAHGLPLQFLAAAHEHDEAGVVTFDRDGIIQYVNPAFEQLSGLARSEAIGRDLSDLLNHGRIPELFRMMNQALNGEESLSSRIATDGKEGRRCELAARVAPLRDEAGAVTHYVLIAREVTREVLLEEQLREAQKMEAIGALAGGIAHDFNNILGTIITCTEMALDDTPGESPVREDLEQVLKAGKRGRSLIRQILTFSRTSEQQIEPSRMEPVVKEGLKLLRSSLPANIEIRRELVSGPSLVLADAVQVHQILMNLCTNAAHAMQTGGGVIEVRLDEVTVGAPRVVNSGTLQPGSYVRLTVRDTGHGMRPEVLERIFDPLFTTKERGAGTGLGLPVVLGIVKSHHGAIAVESEPGKGTTFSVYLPGVEPGGGAAEEPAVAPAPRGRERILLIDDEADLVYAGAKMLRRLGYEVVASSSSVEALELFRAAPERFDLIITDQSMPKMTGVELAKSVLSLRPETPIILCTGFSLDSEEGITVKQAQAIGIREVHLKPLERAEVAEAIRRVLDTSPA